MRFISLIIIPLLSVAILGSSYLFDSTDDSDSGSGYAYQLPWSDTTFEEAIWLAVDEIARREPGLPSDIRTFTVAIPISDDAEDLVSLRFSRDALVQLESGELAADIFIRDHVLFQ